MMRKKAKMGRPPRHEGERLSKSRTFRVRPHLDELLITAAAKAGRSVSEEIEYRLDRSFYEDALPARMAETMAPLVEQAARAGGEAALKVHLQERLTNPESAALRKLLVAFDDVRGRPANTLAELSMWAVESPQGKAALDKIMEEERAAFNKMIQGDLTPEKK